MKSRAPRVLAARRERQAARRRERRNAAEIETRRLSEERFALAIEGSSQGIFDWDMAQDLVFLSRRAQQLLGLEPGALLRTRREWAQLVRYPPEELADTDCSRHANLLAGSAAGDVEFRVLQSNGSVRWLRQRAVVVNGASGRPCRMAGSFDDITDAKLAGEALRESEVRFRSLTELSSDWYWRQDENLRFDYLSSQAGDLTGYSGHSSYGKLRWELTNMTPVSGDWAEHKGVLAARQPFRDLECRRIGTDGTVRYLSMSGTPIFDDRGRFRGYHGIGRNITERKRAEEALRDSEERFALAMEATNEGIFDWDTVADRMYLSRRAQELFGMVPGVPWRPRSEWQALIKVHPEDEVRLRDVIRRHVAGEATCDAEFRVVLQDGGIRWFRQRGIALRDNNHTAYRVVGSYGDITDGKVAQEELQRLERQLRQAQRLEAMGTLAGGIAHDFNNLLGVILGYGEMALRAAQEGSRLRRDLDSIVTAGERGRALVDQILAFSRSSVSERVPVPLEQVVREALDHLTPKLPADVSIVQQLRTGRAAVLGDATQVHQLVMNLTTNALQAMPAGGVVRVGLEAIRIDAPVFATTGQLPAGSYLRLEVADSGLGISPDIVDRIFDPFFTTKEVGVGTGLGLSLVHGIVSELGGAVDVASTPGHGSVFSVYLPAAGEAVEEDDPAIPPVPRGNAERILVVDDEEALLRITTETLEGFGYRTTAFASSREALAAFRANPEGFDAIVTDERMPSLTGSMLIREIRSLRANMPTLLMSGYVGGSFSGSLRESGADEVLKKPLSGVELAVGLARVLERARGTWP